MVESPLYVWGAFTDTYTYQYQGAQRSGTNCLVVLVDVQDPTQYCQAQFKKNTKNVSQFDQAVNKFKDGRRFVMGKVGFADDAKPAYVSCPLKLVVDLSKTRMDTVIGAEDTAVQPTPTLTIASSSSLGKNQFFDVTALVQDMTETREHAENRSSFVVTLYDGSQDTDKKKVKTMPMTLYFDTRQPEQPNANSAGRPVAGQGWRAFLEEHQQKKTAVTFFCVCGGQDNDGKFAFRTTKNSFLAKAVGTKAEKLNTDATLHTLQAEDTVAFDLQVGKSARDWSKEEARETRCTILASFARTATGVAELDEGETFWQINAVRISVPPEGQSIKDSSGKRLWLPLTLLDDSGTIVLYIVEAAAIKLAKVTDANEFEQLHSEGRLRFPFRASVKVWRKPSKTSAEQPGGGFDNGFDCFIVDAAEQDVSEALSSKSAGLLTMLSQSADGGALPTTLDMIRRSDFSQIAVEYSTQGVLPELIPAALAAGQNLRTEPGLPLVRQGAKTLALVLANKRSKVFAAGGEGHRLVTDEVVDYTQKDDPHAKKYSITSFCTLETMTDYKLDPPARQKTQAAMISVTDVLMGDADSAEQPVTSLLADDVQLLTPEEADALLPMYKKMLYYAALAGQLSRKRPNEMWDTEENPAKAAKCRRLCRSPTGAPLPDYVPSPQKSGA